MNINASIEGYRHFLRSRDGEADPYGGTLSKREVFFRRIESEPVRSRHRFDRAAFLRNVLRRRPEPNLEPRLLWLLATAKANQAERFGVELFKLYGRAGGEGDDPEDIHVALQETYHTRVLADVVGIFDLPVPQQPPPLMAWLMIHVMVFNPFPERFVLPLVGMSEMMGCVMFKLLGERGCELFADEPEVVERIRLFYDEILADEICHVGLIEARLGPFGRRVMRGMFRLLAKRLYRTMGPEYGAVIGDEAVAEALRQPFDQSTLAAQFPRTAFAF